MSYSKFKKIWGKVWHFIWEDNSIWSWIVNIILAFVLIKFIVYPGLGFVLGTNFPIVAVVSSSMEHNSVARCVDYGQAEVLGFEIRKCSNYDYNLCGKSFESKQHFGFDDYWDTCGEWYISNTNVTKQDFREYRFSNGFNKGDIMILRGAKPEDTEIGEVIVYRNSQPDPIIHRVVKKWRLDDKYYFQTKGDNNAASGGVDKDISEERVVGKAFVRVPLLGYIKIWAVELFNLVLGVFRNVLS